MHRQASAVGRYRQTQNDQFWAISASQTVIIADMQNGGSRASCSL
jgi:hypothetical protein